MPFLHCLTFLIFTNTSDTCIDIQTTGRERRKCRFYCFFEFPSKYRKITHSPFLPSFERSLKRLTTRRKSGNKRTKFTLFKQSIFRIFYAFLPILSYPPLSSPQPTIARDSPIFFDTPALCWLNEQ